MTSSPEYTAWANMIQRCRNANHPRYDDYGERGIGIYEEWVKDFLAFFADVGPRPGPGWSLDRINNNDGYRPGNVRWSDAKQQIQNRRPRRQPRAAVKRRQSDRELPPLELPPF
jgi:hypothetical protein